MLIVVGFLVGELEAVADTDEVGARTGGACPVLHGVADHHRFRRKTAALLESFFDDESLGVGFFISTADGGNPQRGDEVSFGSLDSMVVIPRR